MFLSEIKEHLSHTETVNFQLPDRSFVPEHFHVTEVGLLTKHCIDCGGTKRLEQVANFQLWNANDTEHRLKAKKLLGIITLSERVLGMEDLEIEVEYQTDTIGKYSLEYDGKNFLLVARHTACLAKENCGIPEDKTSVKNEAVSAVCCAPGGGCC